MRYPIGKLGTREEVETDWYVALGFGEKQDYGYHEGVDWNLKTGGDTDNGQPLYAVSDWELTYYHLNSHNESGFGKHLVYKVDSPFGIRWIHYAHTQNPIDPEKKSSGKVGVKLAEIDKTGRPRTTLPAHLHCSVFKVDPIDIGGIDTIAKTQKQLNDWWEDPLAFFNKWYDYKENDMDIKQLIIDLRTGLLDKPPSDNELKYDLDNWKTPKDFIQRITGDAKFYSKYIQPQLDSLETVLKDGYNKTVSEMETKYQSDLESAKKEAKIEYEKLLISKVENMDWKILLSWGWKNFWKEKKRK